MIDSYDGLQKDFRELAREKSLEEAHHDVMTTDTYIISYIDYLKE